MNKGLFFLKCAACGLLFVTVLGVITMYLWNWLVPDLFHGPVITYWQALGLLVLSKILFWGVGGGGKRGPCETGNGGEPYWKQRFSEKFSSLPADQREEFKRKMKEKWCRFEQDASDDKPERPAN